MSQCQGCVGWRAELTLETELSWIVPVSEASAVFREGYERSELKGNLDQINLSYGVDFDHWLAINYINCA